MGQLIKLRHLLIGLFGLLALISLITIGWNISTARERLRETEWISQANRLGELVLHASVNNGLERGLTVVLLSAPRGSSTPLDEHARIEQLQLQLRARDTQLHAAIQDQLEQLAQIEEFAALRVAAAHLGRAHQRLDEVRRQIDDGGAGKENRITPAEWLETINGHVGALTALRRTALGPRSELDHPFVDNPIIKEVTHTLIEHAGRERALTGAVIAAGRPFTPAEMEELLGLRGVIGETLRKVDMVVGRLPPDEDIAAAHAAMRTAYQERFGALRREVLAASAQGKPYPVNGIEWVEASTVAIDTMTALAARFDQHTLDDIRLVQEQARRNLSLYLLMGVSVLLILLATVFILRWRALRPLRRLEHVARTIGAGDLHQPVGDFCRDELGEMAAALETMRTNLLSQVQERERITTQLRDLAVREQAERTRNEYQALLAQIIDGDPVPTFVIDDQHRVTHWNRACEVITRQPAADVVGTKAHQCVFYAADRPTMADLIVDGALKDQLLMHYRDKRLTRSPFIAGAYEAEAFFPEFGDDGCYLFFTAAPLTAADGRIIGAIETLQDVTERRRAEEALLKHQRVLEALVDKRTRELADTHSQLLQSEKLASIGQLAAGMAHEINNPVGFVHSNLKSLTHYFEMLLRVLEHFDANRSLIEGTGEAGKAWVAEVEALKAEVDYAYLKEDIPTLLAESRDGVERVRRIVQDLRDFSRVDSNMEWELVDLRSGLDSTLNIVKSEVSRHADVLREYGEIPAVECLPAQLNQVFMNLMVNAAQAMPEDRRGTITLRCGVAGENVWVEVADTGSGMPPEVQKRIFDPFYTTKPVGKGTGLGLSLSHGIMEKHGGRIEVQSQLGVGTTFRITLPIRRNAATT